VIPPKAFCSVTSLTKGGDERKTEMNKSRGNTDPVMLKRQGLIFNWHHLPYNPKLVERAKTLRKNMTKAEQKLWYEFLRTFRCRFHRQRPIDNFIVDFYCPSIGLVVELDGGQHYTKEGMAKDRERTVILKGHGVTVLRFANDEVLKDFDRVCMAIEERARAVLDSGD